MSPSSHLRLSLPGAVLATVALLSTVPLAAQAASYTYIDQKAPYVNNGGLNALNLPKIGTTFKVQVPESGQSSNLSWGYANCYPIRLPSCPVPYDYIYWFSYLAIGVRNPAVAIPALNGFLFTSAEIVMPTPWRNGIRTPGSVTMSFPIPNSPQLVGVKFYQQVLVQVLPWWPGTYSSLSRGGVGVIGK